MNKNFFRLMALKLMLFMTGFISIFLSCFAAADKNMGAFVYTELQISASFDSVPWEKVNANIKAQSGFINKTWLSGNGNKSAGGFYMFDSVENATKFVTDYFPQEAKGFGVAQTTRVFEIEKTVDASRDMNSVYFGGKINSDPGAFVYTELQSNIDTFDSGRWKEVNGKLKIQKGLLAKTWLSGLHTEAPGGFYAFDTLVNANQFALEYFPEQAKKMGVAFYTRVFDARVTKEASVDMNSPFYR